MRTGRILTILAPVLATALAGALRIYHLGYHDLRGDEAFSILFSESDWLSLLAQLRTGEPHPPLYFSLLKVWTGIAGETEIATRWLSVAGGVLLCPLVYRAAVITSRSALAGLLAGLFVAAAPFSIQNSQDARMYALGTAFIAGTLYWAARVIDQARKPSWRDAVGLGAFSLLAAYTHYVAVLAVATVHVVLAVAVLVDRRKGRPAARIWLASAAGTALLYAPWLAVAVSVLGPSYRGNVSSPDLVTAVRGLTLSWTSVVPSMFITADYLLVGVWLAVIAGLGYIYWRSPVHALLLACSLVLPFMALFLASRSRPVFSDRYLLLVSPAFYVSSGVGLAAGLRMLRARKPALGLAGIASAALGLVLATALAASLAGYYRDVWSDGPGTWRRVAGYVVQSVGESDLVLVNHLDPTFYYYYRLFGGKAETMVAPPKQGETEPELDAELQPKLTPGRTVWLTEDTVHYWDPKRVADAWLRRHAVRVASTSIEGNAVVEYRVPRNPVRANFADLLALERFEVSTGRPAGSASGSVTVSLGWRALRPVDRDYSVTVQMLDEGGKLVSQRDGPPADGGVPTSGIRTTEIVVDSRTLTAPAIPGTYTLAVAVYDSSTLQRLQVDGTKDNLVVVDSLRLVP